MIFNRTYLGYESPTPDYLCFTSTSAFTVGMSATGSPATPSLEYSKDKITWSTFTAGTTTVSANANENVYLRGNNSYISNGGSSYWKFNITGNNVKASGNIMSLLDETCVSTSISYSYCFASMFGDCTSLTTAPVLPATTLADYCYADMFCGCTSLTTAPALPATTLADYCYADMFRDCTALQVYSSSGTGHDKAWAIPESGTASSYTSQSNMFYGTTGDYSTASSVTLNQTFYTQNEPV